MEKVKKRLWTRDFSIITIGSFISMLGNAVAGFAFGLMVYDKTGSTFLYSLMAVANILPQIVIPIFAGAILDRRSRRITIYAIDFIYTGVYGIIALIINLNFFNYWVYLFIILICGCLNSFYVVAYDSYFPNLICDNNYSKAYAIGSLMYPIASTIMVPLAGWAYEAVGAYPLFAFASITSFFTAIVETRVRAAEPHLLKSKEELEKIVQVT
jgi:MFS family permease